MPGDFRPPALYDSRLFQRLQKPFASPELNELAKSLEANLPDICKIASERMKLMPAIHHQFTLHDETHLLRVVELMARVMPDDVIETVLNPLEICLLILAAYFHDIGMVPNVEDAKRTREGRAYQLARDNWIADYPNLRDALKLHADKHTPLPDKARSEQIIREHEQVIFERFIRERHAEKSADFVRSELGLDPRLRVGTGHVADSLALLCHSHNWPTTQITESNGLFHDKLIGSVSVNLTYLACVLRLADILDFDRERTPNELYRSIHFTSPVSICEWEKHRSVTGWKIDRDAVRFECSCSRPEYERAIHRFLDFVDDELTECQALMRRVPSPFTKYKLELPYRTDRSRIGPEDDFYIFAADFEISLGRDEIINLLMTEKLYGQPSLAIRELLQNSWDALRHRAAIFKRDEQSVWPHGKVDLEHGLTADEKEFVRCTDNGVGMDRHVLTHFLVRAGRSYYRSPEFERERISFRQKGADFDPCARFGIGFMSAFMLGDHITIKTRRYLGLAGGLGEPLTAEINGIGGLIVLRQGTDDQPPGTTIEIVGRRKPDHLLTWNDKVRLVDTVYAYALAGEFPVTARCTIERIADSIEIPAGTARAWHPFSEFGIQKCQVFRQPFDEIDPRLSGEIVCGVPLDTQGRLTLANDECGWKQNPNYRGAELWVKPAEGKTFWTFDGRTCLDGILVAGPHGRGRRGSPLIGSQYRNPIGFHEDRFILDVRGELKPELTPHRSPPDKGALQDPGPGWRKLRRLAARAHGKLWEKVIQAHTDAETSVVLWQILALHHVRLDTLRRGTIWNHIRIPSRSSDGRMFLRTFAEMQPLPFSSGLAPGFAPDSSGSVISLSDEMAAWTDINKVPLVERRVSEAVMSMATVELKDDILTLAFHQPDDPDELAFYDVELDNFQHEFMAIPFGLGLGDVIAASGDKRVLNRKHPVIKKLQEWHNGTFDDPDFAFLYALADALLASDAIEAIARKELLKSGLNHYFSMLGYRFTMLDFDSLPQDLRPPYVCWHPVYGRVELSKGVLEQLAQIQEIDWHRSEEPRYI